MIRDIFKVSVFVDCYGWKSASLLSARSLCPLLPRFKPAATFGLPCSLLFWFFLLSLFCSVSIYFDLDEKQTKSCASVLCGFLRESLGVCDFFALKINGIKILSFHKNTSPDLFHL